MSLQDLKAQNDARVNPVDSKVLEHSELLRAECICLMEETNKACSRMQDDDKKRLDQRVKDIDFLKKTLELKLEELILETENLITLQGRMLKAQEACQDILKATLQCIEERLRRVPEERIYDNVDRELLKERKSIQAVIVLLKQVAEQLTEQIRLNRAAKYTLEKDLHEKFEAQSIDNLCILMTTHSVEDLKKSDGKSLLPPMSVTPLQWESISDINLTKAEQQRDNSKSLRALVESLFDQTSSDLKKQCQATALAFQLNVQELKKVKGEMEDQLAKVLLENNKQKTICAELLVSIQASERCLALAQARLSLRHKRPNKEQCFDPAQLQLLQEIQKTTAYIHKLREAVAQSQDKQRALVQCELELQKYINNKSSALYIDEVLCNQHRESTVINNF